MFSGGDEASTLITEIKTSNEKSFLSPTKKFQVYMIEDSIPPTYFPPN